MSVAAANIYTMMHIDQCFDMQLLGWLAASLVHCEYKKQTGHIELATTLDGQSSINTQR